MPMILADCRFFVNRHRLTGAPHSLAHAPGSRTLREKIERTGISRPAVFFQPPRAVQLRVGSAVIQPARPRGDRWMSGSFTLSAAGEDSAHGPGPVPTPGLSEEFPSGGRLFRRGGVYRDSRICGKVGIQDGQVPGVCQVRPLGHHDRVQESVSFQISFPPFSQPQECKRMPPG